MTQAASTCRHHFCPGEKGRMGVFKVYCFRILLLFIYSGTRVFFHVAGRQLLLMKASLFSLDLSPVCCLG